MLTCVSLCENPTEKMRSFFSVSALPFLLLLLLSFFSFCLASSPAATAPVAAPPGPPQLDTIEEACLMAWKDTPQYEPCVTALRSAPGSRNAALPELAVLATSLSLRDAGAIADRMEKLQLRGGGGATYQEGLARCLSVYGRSITTLQFVVKEIQGGQYGAAGYALASAMEGTDCVDGVGEDTLTEQSEEITILVGLAKTICYKYCTKSAKHVKDCLF